MNRLKDREKFAVNCAKFAALLGISTSIFSVAPIGHAAVVVTASEVGGNVVFSSGGTLNLADLNPVDQACFSTLFVNPSFGVYQGGGSQSCENATVYGPITGPSNFGVGSFAFANNTSGNFAGINLFTGGVVVPNNYISGSSIFSTSTYLTKTFQSLGLTPGVYEWTWGTTNADSYKLIIGQQADVPGPLPLLGAGAAFGWSRRLRKRIATPSATPPQA